MAVADGMDGMVDKSRGAVLAELARNMPSGELETAVHGGNVSLDAPDGLTGEVAQ